MEKVPRPPTVFKDSAIVKFLIFEHDDSSYLRWGPPEKDGSLFTHFAIRNQFLDELLKAGLKSDGLGEIVGGTTVMSLKKIQYIGDCQPYPIAEFEHFKNLVLSKHNDYHVIYEPIGPKQDS